MADRIPTQINYKFIMFLLSANTKSCYSFTFTIIFSIDAF